MNIDTTYMTVKKVEMLMKFLKRKYNEVYLKTTGGQTFIIVKS